MPDKEEKTAAAVVTAPTPEKRPPKPGAEKRTPAEWAARVGLLPGQRPHPTVPVGITPAVYAGVCKANGWDNKPVSLTREKFLDALVAWFRAPTAHTSLRQRRFQRRVTAIQVERAIATGEVV